MDKRHLMIDLETLGTKSNSVILQIAAVEFDIMTGETFNFFNSFINIDSCQRYGLKKEQRTVDWWESQSEEAKEIFTKCNSGLSLNKSLTDFEFFITLFGQFEGVWGNGSSFDLGLLDDAFCAVGIENPIPFWAERDVRTINMLMPDVRNNIPFDGVPHNAVDDCMFQIKYICEIIKKLQISF